MTAGDTTARTPPAGSGPGDLERQIQATARQLFALTEQARPSRLSQERLQAEIMDWAMEDERLKVELFRFVDVFPTLSSSAEIARHLREYFSQPGVEPPRALRWALGAAGPHSPLSPVAAHVIRRQMLSFARRFIVGVDARDALHALAELRDHGTGFTLDVLGEASVSAGEAAAYQARYLDLLDVLAGEAQRFKEVPVVDRAAWGTLPRVNVSIKVTSLDSQIDPLDLRGSVDAVKSALRPVFRKAVQTGAFLNLDLEQFRYRDLTYTVFTELLDEPEFRAYEHAGVVVQAYLRDAEHDLRNLIDWARAAPRPVTIRLVKGAYWDYETVMARQEGWPVPVFTHKPDSDAMFERLAALMLEASDVVRPAFASHNLRSLAAAIATARSLGLRDDAFEIQMLHGMGAPVKHAVGALGLRLREYTPVGEIIPGMAYLVRRLLENTANESFLRQTFVEKAEVERLILPPQPSAEFGIPPERLPRPRATDPDAPGAFVNHPHADLARDENRRALAHALELVRGRLGREHPLVIGGRPRATTETIVSVDPARPDRVVGVASCAGPADARDAVAAARDALPRLARHAGARARRRALQGRRVHAPRAARTRGADDASRPASPPARPTPTWARRSTSSSTTAARRCVSPTRAAWATGPASTTSTSTSRAASPP